jgi:hypothetical protein
MIAPLSQWPMWVRVAVIAPFAFASAFGWWPKNTREWRLYGIMLASFTFFCVVMICKWPTWVRVAVIASLAFNFAAHSFGWWPKSIREWRLYGIVLACFTVFCVVMTCEFRV